MCKKLVFAALFALLAGQIAYSQDFYSQFKPKHKKVLEKWLTGKTRLRPAVENDASKEDLEAWRRTNTSFYPYYAVGDFNQDGKEDFAVLLKAEGVDDEGAIAVFNAPFSNSKPVYFEQGFGVKQFYIEYYREEKMLYLTAYETHGFYLKPKGKTYAKYYPE